MTIDSIIKPNDSDSNESNPEDSNSENTDSDPPYISRNIDESEIKTILSNSKQTDFSKILNSRDIQKKRSTNSMFSNSAFVTSDFPIYSRDGKDILFHFANSEHNLIFKNFDIALNQLHTKNNFFLSQEELYPIINDPSTLTTKSSDLKLRRGGIDWAYFVIDTQKYDKLNNYQRALSEKIYGYDFKEAMYLLNNSGIKKTSVHVLAPGYVKYVLKNRRVFAIARFCLLNDFKDRSYFNADCKTIKYLVNPLSALALDKNKSSDTNWCMYGEYLEID
ncbi:MAG: hypothetical protein ACP5N1_03560 [Candidatus Woesearchaeota archaeon]